MKRKAGIIYRTDLDVIKGIAIIAVILFHLGLVKSGYLGVDAFLVINGFLIVPSVLRKIESGDFSYWSFIRKRVMRLWPMVLFATLFCLIIGLIGMLPDDFENLGETIVASNLFSENILLSITTKDYWNVANDYNPLMHLWYVGVLFEFYLLFPVFAIAWKKAFSAKVGGGILLIFLFIASFALYLFPSNIEYIESLKFYHIPFRIFEFMAGGLVAIALHRLKIEKKSWDIGVIILLTIILFSSVVYFDPQNIGTDVLKICGADIDVPSYLILPKQVLLVITVLVTSTAIITGGSLPTPLRCGILEYFGKRSYSLFIWHQVLIAFYRYFISNQITILYLLVFTIVLLVLTELTYQLVEKRFKDDKKTWGLCVLMSLLIMLSGGFVYLNAGVVRDVPELDIYKQDAHRGMHAEYVDRAYDYDKDFLEGSGKIKTLVMGNSYGRDMCNVLLESDYADRIELSYVYEWDDNNKGRIPDADVIFVFADKNMVPSFVWENKKLETEVYGIGTKNYGQCNGIIYLHRYSNDYTKQTVPLHPWYKETNEKWKKEWGDHYINFLDMSLVGRDRVRVFSEDGKFISQDCYHLSPTGAQWYASKIDFSKIFK